MKYTLENGIHIVEIPVEDFRIVMNDSRKKTAAQKNFCNAGFFGVYHEKGVQFTLPSGHLVCDYAATNSWTRYYCKERGEFNGSKFTFDSGNWTYQNQFYGKAQTTFIVQFGKATMLDLYHAPEDVDYAIAGVPIMRGGKDVAFSSYVKGQGWGSGSLYNTSHIFIGIKSASADTVYVMGMKTTSGNMITSAEAYKKFKALDFYDVIKLDGGGSAILNIEKKNKICTSENRQINNIILFGDLEQTVPAPSTSTTTTITNNNPYRKPTVTLRKGSTGEGVKWLQYQLNFIGYNCGKVDGIFGTNTRAQVLKFQKDKGLDRDGLVGPLTRKALEEN